MPSYSTDDINVVVKQLAKLHIDHDKYSKKTLDTSNNTIYQVGYFQSVQKAGANKP